MNHGHVTFECDFFTCTAKSSNQNIGESSNVVSVFFFTKNILNIPSK
jgi:hypothetical protein